MMYTKEDFNKVWKDSSREDILNQFYYDHMEMEKFKNIINELEKWLESEIDRVIKLMRPIKGIEPYGKEKYYFETILLRYKEVLNKLQELKGSNNND